MTDAERPVVVVAGAAGRLGSAIVEALAAHGTRLVLADRDGDALEHARTLADDACLAVPTDLRDGGQVDSLVARTLETFGTVDAVVNGAGAEGPVGPLEDVSAEELVELFDVNVFGPFRLLKAVLPFFKERRQGRIVNVASGAGLAGTEYSAPYSSSKHALVGLTRSLAREVAGYGITANAVCPGCIDSPMMDRIEQRLEAVTGVRASFVDAIPAGRYAAPAEVAGLVSYLALEAPPYLTGATLVIDGALRA